MRKKEDAKERLFLSTIVYEHDCFYWSTATKMAKMTLNGAAGEV